MLALLIFVLGLSLLGIARPQSQRRAKAQLVAHCTVPNTVALTFDDGPYIYMDDISNTLKNAKAIGTFFLNGKNYGCIYDEDNVQRIKRAYNMGHQIASHTWAHKNLTSLSRDQIKSEMERIENALKRITGAQPAFMRPPYGNYNDLVLEVSGSRAQSVVIWDFDSGDSVGASVDDQKKRYNDAIKRHPSTILAINHEIHESTAHQTLPYAIQELQKAGYKLVSLADCVGQSAYQSMSEPSSRTDDWKC